MSTSEKVREIMISKKLSDTEKRDQLRALIPADVFKIDNLNKATRSQLRRLKEAIAVAEALQQLNCEFLKTGPNHRDDPADARPTEQRR